MRSKWQSCGVVALVVLAAACAAPAAPPEEPAAPAAAQEEDLAAIRAVISEATLVAYTDLERNMALHTDDAVWMAPDEPAHVGKEAVRARSRAVTENFGGEWTSDVEDIHLDGDTAVVRTSYAEATTPIAGGPTTSAVGKEVWVLERQPDGSWSISLMMWNFDEPVTVTEAEASEAQ